MTKAVGQPLRSRAEGLRSPYTKEDVNLLSTLADQTAVALENARHFADLLKLNEDLRRTYAPLRRLMSSYAR